MANCKKCGYFVKPGGRFCPQCGAEIPIEELYHAAPATPTTPTAPAEPVTPAAPAAPVELAAPAEPAAPEAPKTEEKAPRKSAPVALIVALIVVAFLAALVGGYFVYFRQRTSTAPVEEDQVTTQETEESAEKAEPESVEPAEETNAYSAEEVFNLFAPAVFYVEVYDKNEIPLGTGSGFFLEADGVAITNYHVIEGASSAKIVTNDDKSFKVEGVWAWSEEEDWAIIQVSGDEFPALTPASDPVQTGQTVFSIGSPMGLQNTISEGIVSSAERELGGQVFIQTSAAISPGSSGGALMDANGYVVGITSAVYNDDAAQNLGFAIPIEKVLGKDLKTLTPLDELFADAEPVEEDTEGANLSHAEVMMQLVAWIDENRNHEDTDPTVFFDEEGEDGSYSATYISSISDSGYISIQYYYLTTEDVLCSAMLLLDYYSTECVLLYDYYDGEPYEDEAATASATFDAADINLDVPIPFEEYTGEEGFRADHEQIASDLTSLALIDLELIFLSDPVFFSGCDIRNLGFTNL